MKKLILILIFFSITNINAQVTDVINSGLNNVQDLYFVGSELYIADFGLNKIVKADISLSNPTVSDVLSTANPRAITFFSNQLIVGTNSNFIRKYDLNDISNSTIEVFNVNPHAFAINNNLLFIAETNFFKITRKNLSNPPDIAEDIVAVTRPNDLCLVGNIMYIAEGDSEAVSSFNINDAIPVITNLVVNIGGSTQAITVLNDYLYLAINNPNKIYRINLSNSNSTLEEIATLQNNVSALETYNNELYIGSGNTVKKLNLNTLSIPNNQIIENDYKIYPNPTTEFIFISGDIKKSNNIKVYDINGRLIINEINIQNKVNVSKLESGIYFIQIDNLKIKKFIKK